MTSRFSQSEPSEESAEDTSTKKEKESRSAQKPPAQPSRSVRQPAAQPSQSVESRVARYVHELALRRKDLRLPVPELVGALRINGFDQDPWDLTMLTENDLASFGLGLSMRTRKILVRLFAELAAPQMGSAPSVSPPQKDSAGQSAQSSAKDSADETPAVMLSEGTQTKSADDSAPAVEMLSEGTQTKPQSMLAPSAGVSKEAFICQEVPSSEAVPRLSVTALRQQLRSRGLSEDGFKWELEERSLISSCGGRRASTVYLTTKLVGCIIFFS